MSKCCAFCVVRSDNGIPPSRCHLTGGRDDHDQLCDDWHIAHGLDLGPVAVNQQFAKVSVAFRASLWQLCYTDLKQSQL